MAEIVDVEFVAGPLDGLQLTLLTPPLNWELTLPGAGFGQRHLYMLDLTNCGQFQFAYQGARFKECAGVN